MEDIQQKKYVPYATQEAAQARIDAINAAYAEIWVAPTDNYANVIAATDGNYYVSILEGYEQAFSESELSAAVAELPE